MKKKLLVLTSTFPRWQDDHLPSFVYELARRQNAQLQVHVLAPYSKEASPRETMDGMNIRRFKYWPSKRDYFAGSAILPALKKNKLLWCVVPLFLLFQFAHMARIVSSEAIDIVHAHWILPQGLLAVLFSKFFNKRLPVVITSHGADVFGLRAFGFLKRYALNNSSGLTVVSNAIKEAARRLGVHDSIPVEVIPMGVDLACFSPERYDNSLREKYCIRGPFLLFVGRLSEKKGVKYLLEAMPAILHRFPNAKLLIVGHGEDRDKLELLAGQLGVLGERVVFLGGVPNAELPRFYATADVFVAPSIIASHGDMEGFGLVFVEAMGCGCAVVATDLPAIGDIVSHRKTGLIVQQKNSTAITEAVVELLENPGLRERLKKNAREFVHERYDWKVITERYNAFLLMRQTHG